MINIEQYLRDIDAPWNVRNAVVYFISTLKKFLGNDLEVKYLFISTWLVDREYEYGDALWLFTKNNMIKCSHLKDTGMGNKPEFDIYTLGVSTLHSNIKVGKYNQVDIEIQLANGEVESFKAIGENSPYLVSLYKEVFYKEV